MGHTDVGLLHYITLATRRFQCRSCHS